MKQINKRLTIKDTRRIIGISQSKASKILGLPIKTLQNWEQEIRSCPDWLEEIIIEKLFEWFDNDFDANRGKYMEKLINNNYVIKYIEYGTEKEMEADASNGSSGLKKALNYWQGAYGFEMCSAPIIMSITSPRGKDVMHSYIESFNERSLRITQSADADMDHQDMSWAMPKSTKDILDVLNKAIKDMPAEDDD